MHFCKNFKASLAAPLLAKVLLQSLLDSRLLQVYLKTQNRNIWGFFMR